VQNYTNTIGVGAIATVACDPNDTANSQKYAAIAGGWNSAQPDTDETANSQDVPVVASFPGRMDWNTKSRSTAALTAGSSSSPTPAASRTTAARHELKHAKSVALALVGRLFAATTGRDDYSPFE
jgi:hypothetical protein